MKDRELIERLEKIKFFYSMSTLELSKKTGISFSILRIIIIMEGHRKITFEEFKQIATAFPQINARWLLLGQGEFLILKPGEKVERFKLRINIFVSDVKLTLNINREDEELYRVAGKCLKKEITDYCLVHPEFTIERIIKLVGFRFAIELTKNENINKKECNINNFRFYREVVGIYKKKEDFYREEYSDKSPKILLARIAYHFAVNNQCFKVHQ